MQGKFEFHVVNHGLFYTGKILDDNNKNTMNFIYDIGSASGKELINTRIDDYLKANSDIKEIDVLFLSHLDVDHINGLEFLFKHTKVKVKSVIMPYLSVSEWAFFGYLANRNGDSLSSFYDNPYSFFDKDCNIYLFSASEITVINDKDSFKEEIKESRNEFENAILKGEFKVYKSDSFSNVSLFIPSDGNLITYKNWCFELYQPGHSKEYKEKLVKDITTILTNAGILPSHLNLSTSNVGNLLCDVTKRIKDRIKNIDCIIVKHYPVQLEKRKDTLLTGDASSAKIYNPKDGLLSSKNNYYVVQVPHHGSRITSKKNTVKAHIVNSVICHDPHGRYKVNSNTEKAYKNSSNIIIHVPDLKKSNSFRYFVP